MYKILVIDSSSQSLSLLSQRLTSFSYNVLTADNGNSGYTKAKLFLPDLVIVSGELSDMSGFDICKKLKDNEDTKMILILFMSSLQTKDSQIRAFEVGADDYIEKNSDSFIFLSKVKALLRVKHLVRQLSKKYLELEERDRVLDYQLKMSQQIQRSIMKNFDFQVQDVYFASRYMPALDIGGDFYDIVQLSDTLVGVIIGDVSGHGISAALLTAMLNMMFRNLYLKYPNPDQLLSLMNKQFCQIFDTSINETYACVFYAIIDTENRKLFYSNAGLTFPLFVCKEDATVRELEISGTPIGIIEQSTYDLSVLTFDKGDLLLFYTDGLCDTYYKDANEEFLMRIKDLLLDSLWIETPKDIIPMLLNVFYNFNATASEKYTLDDVSLILCQM